MAATPPDWRTRVLDDGRVVEFLTAEWCGIDPGVNVVPGTLPARITYTIDARVCSTVVDLPDTVVLAALNNGDA